MKKIIGILQPFQLKQQFYVYEDGNKIAVAEPKQDEIYDTVLGWVKEYDIKQVDLLGPKQYGRGIKKRLLEAELTAYNTSENTLEVNLLKG